MKAAASKARAAQPHLPARGHGRPPCSRSRLATRWGAALSRPQLPCPPPTPPHDLPDIYQIGGPAPDTSRAARVRPNFGGKRETFEKLARRRPSTCPSVRPSVRVRSGFLGAFPLFFLGPFWRVRSVQKRSWWCFFVRGVSSASAAAGARCLEGGAAVARGGGRRRRRRSAKEVDTRREQATYAL